MKTARIPAVGLLLLAAGLVVMSARVFRAQLRPDEIHPSPALTRVLSLGDFNPELAGGPGDAEVYVFEGDGVGGSLLVLGGTHPDEIAGVLAAVLLVETLEVEAGRVFVVPRANASAATHTRPGEAHPSHVAIETPGGPRRFRCGARFANPVHQTPDPITFRRDDVPYVRTGREARNLNRAYPGVRDGTLTERIAWAVMELIRRERIDLAFDLHEAPPDRRLVNAIVAAESSLEIATLAVLDLELQGWVFHLESSSSAYRGFSHREWEDGTGARPVLIETANPIQGRWRGRTSADLALTGRDANYLAMAGRGRLFMPYDESGVPVDGRVARQLAAVRAVLEAHNAERPDAAVRLGGVPAAEAIRSEGLGAHLAPPH